MNSEHSWWLWKCMDMLNSAGNVCNVSDILILSIKPLCVSVSHHIYFFCVSINLLFSFAWLAQVQYHIIKTVDGAEIERIIPYFTYFYILHSISILLWPPGASTLDPEMCGRYKLSVMVKDMAGKANAFFTTGIVTVEVTGNTWASPDPVRLQENLPGPYPIPISQVRHTTHIFTLKHLRTENILVYIKTTFTYLISPINYANRSGVSAGLIVKHFQQSTIILQ